MNLKHLRKIGLTTLYNYNYGSALQCFATQHYLEQNFCDVDIICNTPAGNLITGKLNTLLNLGGICFKNIRNTKNIICQKTARTKGGLTLTKDSVNAIQHFIASKLNRKYFDLKNLKKVGSSDEYTYFFSGSDQVWNGSMIDNYELYFLRFAEKQKRVAWAPSFGGTEVAPWNKKQFKQYIAEYRELSAREESGAELIKSMTGREAAVLPDPVMLLTGEQWRNLYRCKSIVDLNDKYILAFYIDKPSEKSLNQLKKLQKESGLNIITFGYNHDELKGLNKHIHIDGDPFDFLNMIDNASIVFTDSYHACVFSLLFGSKFYVFSRNYQHKQNQSIRIATLLSHAGMPELFDSDNCSFSNEKEEYYSAEAYFNEMRDKADSYLTDNLGIPKFKKTGPVLAEKSSCCGCGACLNACKVHAIKLEKNRNGFLYPTVDNEKCISCGACVRTCAYTEKSLANEKQQKETFIAYANDDLEKKSSSGGIFAVLAREIIHKGGIVYGAAIVNTDDGLKCIHIAAKTEAELALLQGSKYVQSDTSLVFSDIKECLNEGLNVLFSGTSCQVAALKKYLNKDYENLYLVDLICHGVPSGELFDDYINYIEKKYNKAVYNVSFRRKDLTEPGQKLNPYYFTFTFTDSTEVTISLRDSAYYRMFMSMAGYRQNCYSCRFASAVKPSDITLGDWYLNTSDRYYSSIIVHTPKGKSLLDSVPIIEKQPIELDACVSAHEQLQHPSLPTRQGEVLWALYEQYGFEAVQKYIDRRNMIFALPKKLLDTIKKR